MVPALPDLALAPSNASLPAAALWSETTSWIANGNFGISAAFGCMWSELQIVEVIQNEDTNDLGIQKRAAI